MGLITSVWSSWSLPCLSLDRYFFLSRATAASRIRQAATITTVIVVTTAEDGPEDRADEDTAKGASEGETDGLEVARGGMHI